MGGLKLAFVFPGQGSQSVGMGLAWAESFPEARAAFEEADDTLGWSLSKLCWEGPEEDLQLTANTQPAILAASIAIHRVLEKQGLGPTVMAGHSLGEYSALVAAGTLTYADALRLVRRRGQLMQEAVPVGRGAMAAILGMDADAVAEVARAASGIGVCSIANLNSPVQTVLAGDRAAVERAVELATERGARRSVMLPVSAPFHSSLMKPAREALTPYLEETKFEDPSPVVVSNVDAEPVRSGAAARDALIRQVDGPVRWVESVQWMADKKHVELIVEVGPGAVLTGLGRRCVPGLKGLSLSEPKSLEKLARLRSQFE